MDSTAATAWLTQFVDQNIRIHASDGRVFGGQMKCTDKDCNIILALTQEYRAPSVEVVRKTVEASENTSTLVPWPSRYVGLVVVPGHYVRRIELEESSLPGRRHLLL